ncbi:histone demethylase JARID1, partial [Paragonimus westermani]
MVSLTEVETEFWRLMHSEDTDVVVEYGADLSAREFGSGFPMAPRDSADEYVTSPWNLNNLSVAERSALRFLPRDISGMIVPWVYVGMVFSCFCWHTEDHWSYSINYLHTGSPKTWYGVPTDSADAFEAAMRAEVPELFEVSPDLLHHITTMLSPSKIQAHGVPVYRVDQLAGEFVITFPRAYHAGFNQGFNFAEAVNFCPPDWFEMGQSCIEHYAVFRRAPVFSHAELLCRMTLSDEPLSVEFLVVVLKQLRNLFAKERDLRRHLARLGVRRAERMVFEDSDDDQRECAMCHTILYLSALACKCSPCKIFFL